MMTWLEKNANNRLSVRLPASVRTGFPADGNCTICRIHVRDLRTSDGYSGPAAVSYASLPRLRARSADARAG